MNMSAILPLRLAPSMAAAFRAEILKLQRRPAAWTVLVIAVLDLVVSLYSGFYSQYLQIEAGDMLPQVPAPFILQGLMPDQVVKALLSAPLQTWGLYTIALVLGALVTGSEWGWGTVKTELAQEPSRVGVYLGQLLALAAFFAVLVPLLFLLGIVASLIVAHAQQQSVTWPSPIEFVAGMGTAFLLAMMPATLGAMLATMLRSAAFGIGVGLAWFLVVEQAIQTLAFASPIISAITNWLPRANADSLAGSFGQWAGSLQPPFQPAHGSPPRFVAILTLYIVVFSLLGILSLQRHDVA